MTKRSESRQDLVGPRLCTEVSIVWVNNLAFRIQASCSRAWLSQGHGPLGSSAPTSPKLEQ